MERKLNDYINSVLRSEGLPVQVIHDNIIKHAINSGLVNYIDNETPRHYFISAHADIKHIEEFVKLFLDECIEVMMKNDYHGEWLGEKLKEHYGFTDSDTNNQL
jgi:hypothetical protein